MEIRKSLTAIGAALMMVGISTPAAAEFSCGPDNGYDKDVVAMGLADIAERLRCADDADELNKGLWVDAPIWEKRREPSCEIHQKLARNLLEYRDFSAGNKPPKNKNDTNLAAGASWSVQFGKFEEALSQLDSFYAAASKATLNSENPNAGDIRALLLADISEARMCVYQLSLQ
jgi:hypothetical protein